MILFRYLTTNLVKCVNFISLLGLTMEYQSMALTFWNFTRELTNTIHVRMASLCWYTAGESHNVMLYVLVYYLLLMYVCSAGVGRTGTFIAIDIEIQRIDNDSLVDVHNSVCRLRFWRNFMVQTVVRYDPFTHKTIYSAMFYNSTHMVKIFIMFTAVIRAS